MQKQWVLCDEIKMPLIAILSDTERLGARINVKDLNEQTETLKIRFTALEGKTYELAGEAFNLGCPKQLAVILYEKH
jgi:DNA polymerase I